MSFAGFPKGGDRFFQELAAEMTREWFAAHKHEYEALWLHPMEALLDDVRARLVPSWKALGLAEPKVFRIHRDVRFAKDKSPYKTHIAGVLMTGKGEPDADAMPARPAALYLSLGGEEFSGAGAWMFGPDQLVRWRKAIVDAKKGAELAKLVEAAKSKKWDVHARDSLVRVPKGIDPAHPRAELAKLKGLSVGFPNIPKGLVFKPGLADWLAERVDEARPLITWIAKHVG